LEKVALSQMDSGAQPTADTWFAISLSLSYPIGTGAGIPYA
jgi:hypothetical protein